MRSELEMRERIDWLIEHISMKAPEQRDEYWVGTSEIRSLKWVLGEDS